jgi:3-oxoacyl-[acyl-carrier protein] reductase
LKDGHRRFDGKVALVTGSGGPGIGSACARAFAEQGAAVVVSDRSARRASEVGEMLRTETDAQVVDLHMDVAEEESVATAITHVVERLGGVDILVNNAGMSEISKVIETTLDSWNRVIAVCLTGPFLTMRHCIPQMVEAGGGAVVNIASVQAWIGTDDGLASYSAAKAGLLALTRTTAAEVGRYGVRVNAVAPGLIYNEGIREQFGDAFVDGITAQTPLGRMGRPDDMAAAVLYLASDDSSFVTGEVHCVSGGFYYHA